MGEVAGTPHPQASHRDGRSKLVRWLRISVILNLVLAGTVIGILASRLFLAAAPTFPVPPMPADMIRSLFQGVIDDTLQGDRNAEALSVVDRHLQTFADTFGEAPGQGPAVAFDANRMSQIFLEGDLSQELVDAWLEERKAIGEAHLRLVSGIFLDLSNLLDRGERETLLAAVRSRICQRWACEAGDNAP